MSRPPALARLGAIAASHHERLDGSGHHRGLAGPAITATGRLLAAADVYHAMTEPRPHRPPLSAKEATAALRAEVRSGHLAAGAVDAVLAAAGQQRGKRRAGPAGLTPHEVEVLTLIARGASNRQVAQSLGISPRTAGTHIERIYAKIGAPTRSTATLFAMQPACSTRSHRSICRANSGRRGASALSGHYSVSSPVVASIRSRTSEEPERAPRRRGRTGRRSDTTVVVVVADDVHVGGGGKRGGAASGGGNHVSAAGNYPGQWRKT